MQKGITKENISELEYIKNANKKTLIYIKFENIQIAMSPEDSGGRGYITFKTLNMCTLLHVTYTSINLLKATSHFYEF